MWMWPWNGVQARRRATQLEQKYSRSDTRHPGLRLVCSFTKSSHFLEYKNFLDKIYRWKWPRKKGSDVRAQCARSVASQDSFHYGQDFIKPAQFESDSQPKVSIFAELIFDNQNGFFSHQGLKSSSQNLVRLWVLIKCNLALITN